MTELPDRLIRKLARRAADGADLAQLEVAVARYRSTRCKARARSRGMEQCRAKAERYGVCRHHGARGGTQRTLLGLFKAWKRLTWAQRLPDAELVARLVAGGRVSEQEAAELLVQLEQQRRPCK
jgi:hypothetical protein